jgi:putative transposase
MLLTAGYHPRLHDRGGQYRRSNSRSGSPTTTLSPRSARKSDSLDKVVAESFNGRYKWKLICRQGPWRGLDDVEFATMTYVDWFNQHRLHGEITDDATYTTPAEAEAAYYRQTTTAVEAMTQ